MSEDITATVSKAEPIFMKGTQSSDYVLIGVKGTIGLMFRFMPGDISSPVSGYALLGGRLHSQNVKNKVPVGFELKDDVVVFGDDKARLTGSWPAIEGWEDVSSSRAATNIVVAVEGEWRAEKAVELEANLNASEAVQKIASTLLFAVEGADWIIDEEVLTEFLAKRTADVITSMKNAYQASIDRKAKYEAAQAAAAEKMKSALGKVMNTDAFNKAVQVAYNGPSAASDVDDIDDDSDGDSDD